MSYRSPARIVCEELGIGWQTGFDVSYTVRPIAQRFNVVRSWNGVGKNLGEDEFGLYQFRISSGSGDMRPPALWSLHELAAFSLVPENEVCLVIPTGGTAVNFKRPVHSARALTMGFEDVAHSFSGKTVTLSAPAASPVRVYARLRFDVFCVEPWEETYQSASAESQWSVTVEEVGGTF